MQQAWVARYSGPINSTAAAVAMALDGSGNVYVAGSLIWTNGASDYLTVKYAANGTQLWAQAYDGPSNAVDIAKALAVDGAGDVYVTGASEGTIATVKYDPSGNQLWVARYENSSGSGATPMAITADDFENVYVCGLALGGYLVIKYGPEGSQRWTARYRGSYQGADFVDSPAAIVMDAAANVYVTGASVRSLAFDFEGNPIPQYDYATVKYDTSGTLLWAARWRGWERSSDFANAIAVDKNGNVYVTGGAGDCDYDRFGRIICAYDYATVKYDQNGNQLWSVRFDGPAKDDDVATAVAIDNLSNVLVTGWSYLPVHGDVGQDGVTIKYDEQGNQLWLAHYSDPDHVNKPSAITMDRQGNIYVGGSSYGGTNTLYDFAVVKYDGNGNQLWVARYDGPDHGEDIPVGFGLDKSNNIYVSGSRPFWTGTTNPFTTVKFVQTALSGLPAIATAPQGQSATEGDTVFFSIAATGAEPLSYQWRFDGFDIPGATNAMLTLPYIQTSQAGDYSVVVANSIGLTASAAARLIISPRLQLAWLATYGAELDPYDAVNAIAVDDAGNVFVTGYVVTDNNGNADYATVKYDTSGSQLWAARYNGLASGNDVAVAMAVDRSGNAYVTGYSQGLGTRDDYATLKYDPQGNQLWVARYNGSGNTGDRPAYYAIKVDDAANAYVTGSAGT
ncbi:MAG TPA: SBBP repeat-containing protein, partial [Candidatus Limnocylindrales bacterium]|nr:SBBP repeat-containing protein [Candidatus Limnocylindrales bacterium]